MTPQPFTIAIPDEVLEDLNRRLDNARWPDQAPGEPWSLGIPVTEVKAAVDYWRNQYDWRAREARMNAWPNFMTTAAGEQVHFIHARSKHADAMPMVLTHGWPGSFVEFLDVIGPLTDPEAYGGSAADAFHVVVPSMPGYGFSGPTVQPEFHVNRIADAIAEVMQQLGYDRYVAQGGDWGAIVTRRLGEAYGDRLLGIHLNMIFAFPGADDTDAMAGVTDADNERFAAAGARIADGTGYMAIQSTKPQTLATTSWCTGSRTRLALLRVFMLNRSERIMAQRKAGQDALRFPPDTRSIPMNCCKRRELGPRRNTTSFTGPNKNAADTSLHLSVLKRSSTTFDCSRSRSLAEEFPDSLPRPATYAFADFPACVGSKYSRWR